MLSSQDFVLKSLLVLSTLCLAASFTFIPLPDLPEPGLYMGSTVIGDSIFFVGGMTDTSYTRSNAVREYNVRNQTWTSHPNYQYYISNHCVTSDGVDKIYVFSGFDNANLYIRGTYSISTQEWTYGNMPFFLMSATCVWNEETSKIHTINSLTQEREGYWIYDPVNDSYTNGTVAPPDYVHQNGAVAVFKDSTLYVYGFNLTKMSNDVWTKLQNPPTRFFTGGFSTSNSLWMIGGVSIDQTIHSTMLRYDIASDVWSHEDDLPLSVFALSVARVGPSAFVFGGWTSDDTVSAAGYMIPCIADCPACEICNNSTGFCEAVTEPCTVPVSAPIDPPVTAPVSDTPMNSPSDSTVPSNSPDGSNAPTDANVPNDQSTPSAGPSSSPIRAPRSQLTSSALKLMVNAVVIGLTAVILV